MAYPSATMFIRPGVPGYELVTYTPKGGSARQIAALVDRQPAITHPNVSRGNVQPIEVCVANDNTTGISSTEVDRGGDTITVSVREGGSGEVRIVRGIIEQDEALLTLEVW